MKDSAAFGELRVREATSWLPLVVSPAKDKIVVLRALDVSVVNRISKDPLYIFLDNLPTSR